MKLIIEEGILTLRVKLSDVDLKQVGDGSTVIQVKELKTKEEVDAILGIWRLNVEVCKE
uniref:Uncharacterized protein n=1 Tax=viral metagenome TaxID=1070528 RepID=A0A6M3JTB2_9ZZZZ